MAEISAENETWLAGLLAICNERSKAFKDKNDEAIDIAISFFESDDFNAYATIEGGVDVIRISLGLIFILRNLFDRMLSHPDVLPQVGNPKLENDRSKYPADQTSIRLENAINAYRPFKPKDSTRADCANYLFLCAFEFIFHHEFFHIFFGHVDYLKLKTGLNVLNEMKPRGPGLTNLDRHTLEKDADRNAAWNVLARTIGDYRGQDGIASHLADSDDQKETTRRTRIFGAILAMYSLFRVFSDNSLAATEDDILKSTHPPPLMRQIMATIDVGRDLVYHNVLTEDLYFQIFDDAVRHSELGFIHLMQDSVQQPADPRVTEQKQRNLLNKIEQNWQVLRPQLNSLKRGGIL
jgi:hypothetical protein